MQHLTKSEFAYHELRRRIVDDEIAPGTRLLLRPLADELGLSVMPVRDALRMLEGEGLVTLESHRGATVTQISRDSVLEIIGMRMWMEVLAVVEATERHTPKSLERVQEILREAEEAMRDGDGAAYTAANRRLHEEIEAPAPELIRQLIRDLWERLWQTRRRVALYETLPDRMPAAQEEHAALVEALVARDAEAAREAMERHRSSTLEAWERALPAQENERTAQAGG